MHRRRAEGGACGDLTRPADNERHADTALIEAALTAAQRRVIGDATAAFVATGLRHLAGLTNQPVGPAVATDAPIIAGEDQYRIIRELKLLEFGHQATDTFINAGEHRGIGRVIVSADTGLSLELCDQFRLGLERRVHAEVREVEQERLGLVALDEVDGLIGEKVGEVLALRVFRLRVRLEVEVLAVGFDRLVEAALRWMIVRRAT